MSTEELDDFFKETETTIIFDVSNIAHNTLYAIFNSTPSDNGKFDLWKSAFIGCLFSNIERFNPSRVVLAEDSSNNWRYDIYPEYKWERKIKKKESKIQFDVFYEVLNELLYDIEKTFTNIITIKEDRTEADDVISVLSREIKNDKVIIVSSDKDFHQLLIEKRIQQFKPITKEFVECLNPWKSLQLKILTGDKGDSILPVRPRVGPKTAASILESGLEEFLASDSILRTNWEKNKKLIDLKEIPELYVSNIINKFKNYNIEPLDSMKILKFFNKHRLRAILDKWQVQGEIIKRLNNYGQLETVLVCNSESSEVCNKR